MPELSDPDPELLPFAGLLLFVVAGDCAGWLPISNVCAAASVANMRTIAEYEARTGSNFFTSPLKDSSLWQKVVLQAAFQLLRMRRSSKRAVREFCSKLLLQTEGSRVPRM